MSLQGSWTFNAGTLLYSHTRFHKKKSGSGSGMTTSEHAAVLMQK